MPSLSTLIKDLRTVAGLSREGLSRRIQCSAATLAKWESGLGFPDEVWMASLVKAAAVEGEYDLARSLREAWIDGRAKDLDVMLMDMMDEVSLQLLIKGEDACLEEALLA